MLKISSKVANSSRLGLDFRRTFLHRRSPSTQANFDAIFVALSHACNFVVLELATKIALNCRRLKCDFSPLVYTCDFFAIFIASSSATVVPFESPTKKRAFRVKRKNRTRLLVCWIPDPSGSDFTRVVLWTRSFIVTMHVSLQPGKQTEQKFSHRIKCCLVFYDKLRTHLRGRSKWLCHGF